MSASGGASGGWRAFRFGRRYGFAIAGVACLIAITAPVTADPTLNRIYETAASSVDATKDTAAAPRQTSFDGLIARLKTADIIILGEIHDARAHHDWQARIIKAVAEARKVPPAIVFEAFNRLQQGTLDTFTSAKPANVPGSAGDVAAFKSALKWADSGWPKDDYDPLFEVVLALRAPLVAADPPRESIRRVAKFGEAQMAENEVISLGLDQPLGDALDAASIDEIDASHCGMMPREAYTGMAYAQRYRDALLADATLAAHGKHGQAVLITGATHARTDRGVPWYLARRAPKLRVVSVTFVEAPAGTDPQSIVPRTPDSAPATDIVIATEPVTRPDPCDDMR